MKKKINSISESQIMFREQQTYKEFRKSAKAFFESLVMSPEEGTYYVVKAHIDEDGYVSSYGVVYGEEQRLDLIVESRESIDETFLAEAYCAEDVMTFIKMCKDVSPKENIFIFKVNFKDYELSSIQSFYGGKNDLILKMYPHRDLIDEQTTEAIKILGTLTA